MFKSHFQKANYNSFICNSTIIEANTINVHYFKMRISFSAFEKKSECSKLVVTFSLRINGNFIC